MRVDHEAAGGWPEWAIVLLGLLGIVVAFAAPIVLALTLMVLL